MPNETSPRRAFIKRIVTAGAMVSAPAALSGRRAEAARQAAGIGSFDHVAIPIEKVPEMVAFYRALGFAVREDGQRISVHFAEQKINFHAPWQSSEFTLRASAARPPCGDFCWVWEGTREALVARLERAGAEIVAEGPRPGGRNGGDAVGQSIYTRDPDGNLLEFMRYA